MRKKIVIAYETEDGLDSVYLLGDHDHLKVGKMLLDNYSVEQTVRNLISGGDLYKVEEFLHPILESHSERYPETGVCVYAIRDEGADESHRVKHYVGPGEIDFDGTYAFVFTNGKWNLHLTTEHEHILWELIYPDLHPLSNTTFSMSHTIDRFSILEAEADAEVVTIARVQMTGRVEMFDMHPVIVYAALEAGEWTKTK